MVVAFFTEFVFGQLFKVAQWRGCYNPAVVTVNYLVLAAWLGLYFWGRGELAVTGAMLKVGISCGCVFICAMLVMTGALRRFHVASVLTAFRMSILVPVFASVWLWGERVDGVQVLGIGLALVALVLMTQGGGWGRFEWKALAAVLLVFLSQGTSMTCLRWIKYAGLDGELPKVLLVTGVTAGTLGVLFLAATGYRPARRDVAMGGVVGTYNLVALLILLTALSQVPGTVFFPLMGCVVVTLDNVCAHVLWKEPLGWRGRVGVGLAVGAIVLVL